MTPLRPLDLLLVGRSLEICARAAVREGLSAQAVPTCIEAFAKLAGLAPRVVVLSGSEISGREEEAIQALREEPGRPAILLTIPPHRATGGDESPLWGADDALPEPCYPSELLSRVRLILSRERLASVKREGGEHEPQLLLADIAELNRHVSNLDLLEDRLLAAFARRVAARRASLLRYESSPSTEPGRLVLRRGLGLPEEILTGTTIPLTGTLAGRVAATRRPLLVEDFRRDPHGSLSNQSNYQSFSCLSLPLVAEDRLLAVLNLADKESGRPFTDRDLQDLARFAGHAAQVLDNSLRLERMTRLSILDDLTGLYNRRFFRRSLEREFRRAARYGRPLTLAILDLDHFKILNDKNGHETGNRVLSSVGRILRGSFRNTDIVARYGGEEFAVIFPEIEKGATTASHPASGPPGAYLVLERLRRRILEEHFTGQEALPGGTLTISGGAASFPLDARTMGDLLDAADAALYRAKREGRDRIVLA